MITLSSLISRLPGGAAMGLIYGLMALGVYLTFRVLKTSDLTVDGSFTTGGAVAVMLIVNGCNAIVAMVAAFIAGIIAGIVTGLIHTKLKIPAILSGILVQFGLYSVNLHIMKMSANVSCNPDKFPLLITSRHIPKSIVIGVLIAIVVISALYWFFGTEMGCAIRATGSNEHMALAMGINTDTNKVIGFALGNGLVALAGSVLAQYQGNADVKMGQGAIVIGLAAVIIGEAVCSVFFRKGASFYIKLAFVIIGGIVYYFSMTIILWLRIDANDLKLFTALIVMIFLSIPNLNLKINLKSKKGEM